MSLVYDMPWPSWSHFRQLIQNNRFLPAKAHMYRTLPKLVKACKKHCNITLWNKKNREQNGCGSVSRSLYPIRSRLQMPVINFQNRAFIKDFLSDAGYIYVTLTKSKPTQIEGEWQFLIMRFPNLEAKRQYLSPTSVTYMDIIDQLFLLQHMSKFMKILTAWTKSQ